MGAARYAARIKSGEYAMLILTRHLGESVMIGDEVTVTVLGVRGNQVRLGFTAPANVAVHREEIYKRILAERLINESQTTTSGVITC